MKKRLGWMLAAFLAAPAAGEPALEPVPRPPAGQVEASVLRQLELAYRLIEATRARGGDEARAHAYGQLGELYAAYDLWESAAPALRNARRLETGAFRWAYLSGYVDQQRARLETAAESFERALEIEPRHLAAWLRLGEARLDLHQTAAARRAFERALEIDPEAAAAHFGFGRALAQADDPDGAAEHFERALRLQPEATQIHFPLAQVYRRQGRLDQARAQLARHGEGKVSFPDPLVESLTRKAAGGAFHKFVGDQAALAGRYREAVDAYRRAVAADAENYFYRKSLGLTLNQLGDVASAVRQLEAALGLLSKLPEAQRPAEVVEVRFSLGGLAMNRDDAASAREHFEAVLAADPGYAPAHLQLGNLAGRAGRLEEALAHFSRVLELQPDDPQALLQRATTLMDLGRFAEAVPDLRRRIQLEPGDRRAQWLLERALEATNDG